MVNNSKAIAVGQVAIQQKNKTNMEEKNIVAFQGMDVVAEPIQPSQEAGGFSKRLKKNIFKWHRTIGLITVIPVIFWCLSGLMHPFLAHWFKPTIAKEFIAPKPISKIQLALSVHEVLKQNNIQEFKNFRLVEWGEHLFYQVKLVDDELRYYQTSDGKEVKNADRQYAEYLARYFLNDQASKVKSVTVQTQFDQQYKYVNRLLPVWKVGFERADNMDVYVETSSSRLGTFNPTSRKAFLWVFDNFHNWSFLEKISNNNLRLVIMIILLSVILISAISGLVIYGLFWKRFRGLNSTNEGKGLRKYHRQIGMATAFITITFAFSGMFHATRKFEPNRLPEMVFEPIVKAADLKTASLSLGLDWERLTNLSVIAKGKDHFYQAFYTKTEDAPPSTLYFNAANGKEWKNGNKEYAQYLGLKFWPVLNGQQSIKAACCEDLSSTEIEDELPTLLKAEIVPKFESREYGFVFKRLPVVRLAYDTPNKQTLYVETATSRLAAIIDNTDRAEGYSFAIFHKYLLMDWAGKNVRDITMMFSSFGLLAVSLLGFFLFLKVK